MSVQVSLNKLSQWKRPHKFRSVIAYGPKGIYQVDIMNLYPLWDKIFTSQQKSNYKINDYAFVCVDVYSRYVKARSTGYKYKHLIASTMYSILTIMGKPQIISGDNEIINAFYDQGQLCVEFDGIKFYRTSPPELNKNTIVERMIKTLKKYLLDIFMTFTIKQLHQKFLEYQPEKGLPITFVDYLLDFACEINNSKQHRTIKAIPIQVFNELETNKQKINLTYYPLYPYGTIVIKVP
jgi:hypothetical protein